MRTDKITLGTLIVGEHKLDESLLGKITLGTQITTRQNDTRHTNTRQKDTRHTNHY